MSPTVDDLLDTFPGRLFLRDLRFFDRRGASPQEFVDRAGLDFLVHCASWGVESYLHSGDPLEVVDIDLDDPELRAYAQAAITTLARRTTFRSPQIHQGELSVIRPAMVRCRTPLNALPSGAFWTSTRLDDRKDTWSDRGYNQKPRWEIHFDDEQVCVAQISSATEWQQLIDSHPLEFEGTKYPDWAAIAQDYDAIHLTPLGLLLAHPTISGTPFRSSDGSGTEHSRSGPYISIGDWTTVSTAWMRPPPQAVIRSADPA